MTRITVNDLRARLNRLNRTLGLPEEPYRLNEDGSVVGGNPGTFLLDSAYGGYALNRMAKDGGTGETCVLYRGSMRDLYERMGALLDGIAIERGNHS